MSYQGIGISCPDCGTPARTEKTNWITSEFGNLYCACRNPSCGARFVMQIEMTRLLQATRASNSVIIRTAIDMLSPEERKIIVTGIAGTDKN